MRAHTGTRQCFANDVIFCCMPCCTAFCKKGAISDWLVMTELGELEPEWRSSVRIGLGIRAPSAKVIYGVTVDDVLEMC
jgi:hypothetical protein